MIKVEDRDLYRNGQKIGHVVDGHVFGRNGEKVGSYSSDHVFSLGGSKLARMEGDFIYIFSPEHKIRIEDNNRDVSGGSLSNIEKAAVRVLLGE